MDERARTGAGPTDREQVYDLMVHYGRCVDTHDRELLIRSCYTDDVVVQYDAWVHPGEPISGAEAFRRFWGEGPLDWDSTHQFTNFTFDLGDDEGAYSCLATATHWPRGAEFPADVPVFTVGLRYENRVRRIDSGWRIAVQRNIPLWATGDPTVCARFPTDA